MRKGMSIKHLMFIITGAIGIVALASLGDFGMMGVCVIGGCFGHFVYEKNSIKKRSFTK